MFEKENKRLKRTGRKWRDTVGSTTKQPEIFQGKEKIVDQMCRNFFSFFCFLLCDLRCLSGLCVSNDVRLNSELERS